MKTERRHELKHNELADWLSQKLAAIKPYNRLITGLVIAAVVAVGVYAYTKSQGRREQEEAWQEYFADAVPYRPSAGGFMTDLDVLDRLAEDHAGTPVGNVALLTAANRRKAEGIDKLFRRGQHAAAEEDINTAIGSYTNVISRSDEPILKQQATWGLACAQESLGKLDQARKTYEQLASEWPDGIYAEQASESVKRLTEDSTRHFYDTLAETVAAAPTASEPGSGDAFSDATGLSGKSPTEKLRDFDSVRTPGADALDVPRVKLPVPSAGDDGSGAKQPAPPPPAPPSEP